VLIKSIKNKIIFAMMLIGLVSALFVGIYNIYKNIEENTKAINEYHSTLYEGFDRASRWQVENVHTLIAQIYKQQLNGALSEQEAKKKAADLVRDLHYNNDNYFWIDTTDGVNVVLLGRDTEGKNRYNAQDSSGTYYIQNIIKAGMQPEGGYSQWMFPKPNEKEATLKRGYSLLFTPYQWVIGTGNWTDSMDILVEKKRQELDAQLYSKIMLDLLWCLVAVFISAFFAFVMGNKLGIDHISTIRERVIRMAGGNYSVDVEAAFMNRRDEIGDIGNAFEGLNTGMREIIRNIAQAVERLTASSEELSASAEQSTQAANQITTSITNVATESTTQMEAANEAFTVVEQMSAGIQQIAANANQVASQSKQATEKARNGDKEIEKAVNQMRQIEDTVMNSAQVVTKLDKSSQEIGQIVDTISSIANQTNLLALNAAIEAARAGEQGRGFAVVAEEVRKLSEQSQEAAKQIAELISEIQVDTNKAVVAMNEGTREVKTGTEVVNNAGTAFREIMEVVAYVSDQVKEISAAIEQMASGSQQIVNAVKKIDDLSQKSAGESQGVSAATEEQLASMEEITTSSQALVQLAQDLQTTVAKFQV
jgi:methyl-accepting chemotaxis protein